LRLALDEPKETDKVFENDGIRIVVDASLLERTGPIKIDYIDTEMAQGFSIQSNLSKDRPSCCC